MKNIARLILMLIIISVTLTACKPGKPGAGGNDPTVPDPEGAVFSPNIHLSIVKADGDDSGFTAELQINISKLTGKQPLLVNPGAVKAEHELVVGYCARPVAERAKEKLDSILNETYDAGWVIYAEGGSIAIVYSGEEARELAFEHFRQNYMGEKTLSFDGVHCESKYFILREYYKQLEAEKQEAAWDKLTESNATAAALREHYGLYSDEMLLWLAGLYDPETGGFYHSDSAKETTGFFPDVESTSDALSLIYGSGTADGYKNLKSALPKELRSKLSDYVYALQRKNGCFYDLGTAVITSDRTVLQTYKGMTALSLLGKKARYSASYDSGAPINLTKPLLASSVSAVDFTFPDLGDLEELLLPDYLQSEDAFDEWLSELDIAGDPLTAIKTLNASWSLIETAELDAYCLEAIRGMQDAENGLFEETVSYGAARNFVKIAEFLIGKGSSPDLTDRAAASAAYLITEVSETETVVDAISPWVLLALLESVKGEDAAPLTEGESVDGAALVRATTEKLRAYRKENGSFSYFKDSTAAFMMGTQLAVPGMNEGEIPATMLATSYVTELMWRALGLEDSRLPIYTGAYLEELADNMAANAIPEKTDNEAAHLRYNFEGDPVGEAPVSLSYTLNSPEGHIYAVDAESNRGKVMEISSKKGAGYGDSITIPVSHGTDGEAFVFEGDFRILSSNDIYAVQLTFGDAYLAYFYVKDGNLYVCDSSNHSDPDYTNDFGISIPVGNWFRLRIEHCHSETETVTRIYVNNTLRATSDNYLGKVETGEILPGSAFDTARIYVLFHAETVIQVDSLIFYKTDVPEGTFDKSGEVSGDGGTNDDTTGDGTTEGGITEGGTNDDTTGDGTTDGNSAKGDYEVSIIPGCGEIIFPTVGGAE